MNLIFWRFISVTCEEVSVKFAMFIVIVFVSIRVDRNNTDHLNKCPVQSENGLGMIPD